MINSKISTRNISLILIIMFIAIFVHGHPEIMNAQGNTPTPIYVFPPPTRDSFTEAQREAQNIETGLMEFEIETASCTPICWSTFQPGVTYMDEVIDWFTSKYGDWFTRHSVEQGVFVRNAPNDSIGAFKFVEITAFSDDSNPKTRLRSYYVGIWMSDELDLGNANPRILQWLPANLMNEFGTPVGVYAHSGDGYYRLVLDYPHWLVVYVGTYFTTGQAICPTQRVPYGINFWVYSDRETNGLTFLESIGNYHTSELGAFKPSEKGIRVTRDPAVINQIKDTLLETSCLPLALFESFQIEPTQQPTPTPTPAATFTPPSTFTPTPTDTPTLTPTLTPTTVPTSTPTATIPARFSPLRLRAVCSPFPALFRVWRVENDNRFALPFAWQVVGTRQDGHGVALARFDSTFFTATVRNNPNTVRILVRGVEQDVEASISTQCR